MKWTKKDWMKVVSHGQSMSNAGISHRKIAQTLQKRYFKTRSVESVRHAVRQVVF